MVIKLSRTETVSYLLAAVFCSDPPNTYSTLASLLFVVEDRKGTLPIWFHAMEAEIRYLPPGVPELSRVFSVKGWSGLEYRFPWRTQTK